MNLIIKVVEVAGARLVLLPQQPFHDSAEVFGFVICSRQNARGTVRVVVDFLLRLDYRRYVLNLESIFAEVEVIRCVETAAAVNTLVRNEIGQASEDVSANFALINQVTLFTK